MKEKYEAPKMNVLEFVIDDVIRTCSSSVDLPFVPWNSYTQQKSYTQQSNGWE